MGKNMKNKMGPDNNLIDNSTLSVESYKSNGIDSNEPLFQEDMSPVLQATRVVTGNNFNGNDEFLSQGINSELEFRVNLKDEGDDAQIGIDESDIKVKEGIESVKLMGGIHKDFNHTDKVVKFTVNPLGATWWDYKGALILVASIVVSLLLGWFIVSQVFVTGLFLVLLKYYVDKRQVFQIEKGSILKFKKSKEVNLKDIIKVCVADLKKGEIIEEKPLDYHWYVESLMLSKVNHTSEQVLLSSMRGGRYSILLKIGDDDVEIVRGLSHSQMECLMRELT